MGQYYTATILSDLRVTTMNAQEYGSGMKLMEHANMRNKYVQAVMTNLFYHPGLVYWIGDYANAQDFEKISPSDKPIDNDFIRNALNNEFCRTPYVDEQLLTLPYILNHTKKQYINLRDYSDEYIHPLPLLTAVGNGRGGGDYLGSSTSQVGIWAGDKLSCAFYPPHEEDWKKVILKFKEV